MFRKKTVLEVLDTHNIALSDEMVLNIRKSFNRVKCKSRIKKLNYCEICYQLGRNRDPRDPNDYITILQKDKIITPCDDVDTDTCWQMNPFEDALIIIQRTCCTLGIFYEKTRIVSYCQQTFFETIYLPNIKSLKTNFDLFFVYNRNGDLITKYEDLSPNSEYICFSKDSLRAKSFEWDIKIVMRYHPEYQF